jgi:hypothetical protein
VSTQRRRSERIFGGETKIPDHVREFITENEDDDLIFRKQQPPKPIAFEVFDKAALAENARAGRVSFKSAAAVKPLKMMNNEARDTLFERIATESGSPRRRSASGRFSRRGRRPSSSSAAPGC